MEVDRKALLMRDEQESQQAAWKLVFSREKTSRAWSEMEELGQS